MADVRGGGGGCVRLAGGLVTGAALAAPALLRRGRGPVPADEEEDDADVRRQHKRRRAIWGG